MLLLVVVVLLLLLRMRIPQVHLPHPRPVPLSAVVASAPKHTHTQIAHPTNPDQHPHTHAPCPCCCCCCCCWWWWWWWLVVVGGGGGGWWWWWLVVVVVVVVVVGGGGGRGGGGAAAAAAAAARAHPASPPPASASRPFVCCRRVRTRTHTHPDRTSNQPRPHVPARCSPRPNNRRGIQRRQMFSDWQSTGRGSRVSRVVGFAKTHKSLALVDPRLTKTMERVRTGAVVDVPKGTVVVGDRRRAPRTEHGCEWWRVRAATVSPGSGFRKLGTPGGCEGR